MEDIPVESGETGRTATLTLAKTASLPRQIQPQWPTLQGGSIVSDYLTNLDIVSFQTSSPSAFINRFWLRALFCFVCVTHPFLRLSFILYICFYPLFVVCSTALLCNRAGNVLNCLLSFFLVCRH